jgi:hypothetical protein
MAPPSALALARKVASDEMTSRLEMKIRRAVGYTLGVGGLAQIGAGFVPFVDAAVYPAALACSSSALLGGGLMLYRMGVLSQ